MNIARLTKLVSFLRNNVPVGRFDMETWAGNDDVPFEGHSDLSCGAAACAMGWASTIPEFQEAGLNLTKMVFGHDDLPNAQINFDGLMGYDAVGKFMDLTFRQANYLFDPGYYFSLHPTTEEVAERIEEFVKTGFVPSSVTGDEDDCEPLSEDEPFSEQYPETD